MSNDQVFLSYASENLDMVRKVYEGLKKRNVNVWFDMERLGPGPPWKLQVKKAIVSSRYFVICISEAALKKTGDISPGFQDEELQSAYEIAMAQPVTAFAIIPVRLEDCDRGDHRLSMYQQYDLFRDFEGVLDKLALHMGGESLADKTATDARSEEEKTVQVLLGKAMASWYAGDYEAALTLSHSATLLYPISVEAWLGYGICLAQLGRYGEALEVCNKIIGLKPDDVKAWIIKGSALSMLGCYKEALGAYDRAIELKPDDANVWAVKGIVIARLQRYEEALEAFDKAIGLEPGDANFWGSKADTLGILGRYEEALEAYDKAIELNPDGEDFWGGKGITLHKLGRYEEALQAIARAKELGLEME